MLHGPTPFTLFRRLFTALVVGVLAFGALVAVESPASAATSRSLSAKASPTGAAVRGTVTISGTLSKSPKGSKVTIQRKSGSKWVTAKTTRTTTAAGAYSGKVKLPSKVGTYSFRAVAAAKGSLKKATSKTVKVKALTPVLAKISASPTRLKAGATAKVTGSVKPFVTNTTVTIQKFVNGKYVSTGATAKLSSSGKFSKSLVIKDGSVLRVSVPRAGKYAPGVSAPTAVTADPVISSTSLPTAQRTVAYSAQVVQVGTTAGTWTVTPALPAGLALGKTTGRVTGTPTGPNSSASYTFKLAQPGLTTAAKAVTLAVTDPPVPTPPTIATTSLKAGQKGSSYTTTLAAQNSPTGTWTAAPLPAGLTLNAATGVISGTPTAAGTTNVTIGFTQTSTGLSATPKQFALLINPAPGPSIRTSSLPNAVQNVSYHAQLEASAGATGTWSVTGGVLPLGIVLNQNSGALGGSTLVVGTYTLTFKFHTTDDGDAFATLKLRVVAFQADQYDATVEAGGNNTCRIQQDRTLWCWGADDAGQLGDGGTLTVDPPGQLTPKKIGTATDWSAISVSDDDLPNEAHVCGLRGTAAYCWGSDRDGMLGNGPGVLGAQTAPALVSGGLAWASISAAWTHTCGTTTSGALYCWGDNESGRLGTGTTDQASPVQVGTDLDWESVSGGFNSSCAVKTTGALFCWGSNFRGQLGIGTTDDQAPPTQVGTGTWSSVSVGAGFACAKAISGAISCWGPQTNGQLGDGAKANNPATDERSPKPVSGGSTSWTSFATGESHTCATNTSGELWCWGANGSSQLGDGSTATRTTPTKIGSATDWSTVSAGESHTCAVTTTNETWCWGANAKGKVGIGSAAFTVAVPTKVN